MKLIFRNEYRGTSQLLGEYNTHQECIREIYKFCEDKNFKIYYMRSWIENGVTWYDVGSHAEFFLIEGDENEALESANNSAS